MKTSLNGKWQFKEISQTEWLTACVPGSVYNDLLSIGKIDDPFFRDNEDAACKLSDLSYEYRRSFTVNKIDYSIVNLVCEGLDTIAEIYINGNLLAETQNMHRTYTFNLKERIKCGENEILIRFLSPTRYISEAYQKEPLNHSSCTLDGFTYLRKAHYMFGWDWGPQLPDMGIWRNIYLELENEKINEYHVTQKHSENLVKLHFDIDATTQEGISVCVTSPDGIAYGAKGAACDISIPSPQLWWHVGYGEQPLYDVVISMSGCEKVKFKLGLRTLTVNTEKDEFGNGFCFCINGKNIFAMGSSYIPEDTILARTNEERTRKLLTDCVKANQNCIRVWGGGIYPPDYFYDICDELGIIVWQDFMFA